MPHFSRNTLLVAILAATMLAGCGGADERKAKYLERGKAYLLEENWDKARVEFKNVLQIDPKHAEAYYLYGQIEENNQEWTKAFSNYKRAVDLDPDLIAARAKLARFYLMQANAYKQQGEREGEANALGLAQTEIDAILERDSSHPDGLALRAAILKGEGTTEEAMALAEKVLADQPGNEFAASLLAGMYEENGRVDDAEKVLTQASLKAEKPTRLKLHLAQIYARQGKHVEAEAVLNEIVQSHPDEMAYRVQLAKYLLQNDKAGRAEEVLRDAITAKPGDPQRYLMLADLLAAKNDSKSVIEFLSESINQNPGMHELRLSLARVYEQSGQPEEAKKVYREMIAMYGIEPAGLSARNRLAQHAALSKDYDSALKLTNEVLAENPKDNDALLMKGRLSMQQGDYEEAVASFRSVLKDQPDSIPLLHLLAEVQLRKGDVELAEDNLRRAVEIDPTNVDARLKFSRFLVARKELARALEQIDAVLARDPANIEAITAKSEVLAAKGDLAAVKSELEKLKQASPNSVDASLRLARVYLAEENYTAALNEVDTILAADSSNYGALLLKSDILAKANKIDELTNVIDVLKATSPNNPEGYFRMGRLLRAKGDVEGAIKEFESGYAIAQEAGKLALLSEIINTQVSAGHIDEALARLQSILRDDPEHKVANDLLGLVYMAQKDYAAAENAFTKQIAINPRNATVYAQLAAAREAQKDLPGAAAAYENGLKTLVGNIPLQIGLASVRERQGDPEAAITIYENVIAEQPNNAIAVNNLAALLADFREDEKSLARAQELASKLEQLQQPAIRDTVGWVHYRSGNYSQAIDVLKAVVEAAPQVGIFQYHLGMAYAKAGENENAKTHLKKAIELGNLPDKNEAQSTLDGL